MSTLWRAVLCACAVGWVSPAQADDAPLDLNRFQPALGSERILTTDLAAVGPDWQLVPQLFLHYADRPMVLTIGGEYDSNVVQDRITGDLGVSLSIKDRIQLGVRFPVTLNQGGEALDLMPLQNEGTPVNPPSDISGMGPEDLRVSVKGVLWSDDVFGIGAVGNVVLPTGNGNSYLSSSSPAFDARLIGHVKRERFSAGVQVGWLFASTQQVLLTRTGMALTFGAGAEYQVSQQGDTTISLAAEVFGLAHSRFETTRESPIEMLFAGKAQHRDWTFFLGAGPGLTRGYGEPRVRVLAGLSYAWVPPPPKPKPLIVKKPPPPPPPEKDPPEELRPSTPTWVDSIMTLRSELFFDYDRCAINPKSYDELRRIATALKAHPEWGNIRIDGHASKEEEGSFKDRYNLRLSRCRAQRISQFFEFYGIAKSRLSYYGFGYRCPREDNATEVGRVQNRRVEFVRNPESNPPVCEIPPQLDPLEKHANEPALYRQPDPSKQPATPPTGTPPAGTPPAATPPAAAPPAAAPPAAAPPAPAPTVPAARTGQPNG